nr:hypothetical protein CFP56_37042 [Quercus suber]
MVPNIAVDEPHGTSEDHDVDMDRGTPRPDLSSVYIDISSLAFDSPESAPAQHRSSPRQSSFNKPWHPTCLWRCTCGQGQSSKTSGDYLFCGDPQSSPGHLAAVSLTLTHPYPPHSQTERRQERWVEAVVMPFRASSVHCSTDFRDCACLSAFRVPSGSAFAVQRKRFQHVTCLPCVSLASA